MIREKIKETMKARAVKAIDLANEIGIARSTLSLFLNGKSNLGQEKIEKIFSFLGIELTIKQ